MSPASILFIAPAQAVTKIFPRLKEEGFETGLAETLKGALAYIKKNSPTLVFTRPLMPGYSASDLLAEAQGDDAFPPVVIFTDQGSADQAQAFLEKGAKDYWLEPLAWEKIRAALPGDGASQTLPKAQAGAGLNLDIIGKHPAIARVLALAKQVAKSKATVLIAGGSGTGKEMVARYLHAMSDRDTGPFIAINCAALPEHLLESELFGHEKGAFTGAISRKPGRFELADSGTILLDEISEMDLGLQAKLLRVLQEGEMDRVGGTESVKVDVRVLATTNRNLQEWVDQGKFRQDLFFRLNVIPLRLPDLKDRGEDVLLLARYFVDRFCGQYSLPSLDFSQEAVDWLSDYDWPGNVRELQNLMERCVLLAGKGPITPTHFLLDDESWVPPEESEDIPEETARPLVGEAVENMLGGQVITLQEMERIMIMRGLRQTSGNRTQAAELLGISVRTLRNKLNDYRDQGLDIP
ncbi:MAG: sigma-54-dependent Fis family transcriptional regulator [Desulfovibrio sp.]|nr:MAG: sigma-54-dependent Fis family transcriptional regulator [Desulfovibrio sp.]